MNNPWASIAAGIVTVVVALLILTAVLRSSGGSSSDVHTIPPPQVIIIPPGAEDVAIGGASSTFAAAAWQKQLPGLPYTGTLPFARYWSKHKGFRTRCGAPIGPARYDRSHERWTQRFAHAGCQLRQHKVIARTPTSRRTTPRPQSGSGRSTASPTATRSAAPASATAVPTRQSPPPTREVGTPTPPVARPTLAPPTIGPASDTDFVLSLINASRAQNGAQPVTLNQQQSTCVLPWAIHLSEIGTLSHEGFGVSRPCQPYAAPAGENLGYGSGGNAHQTLQDVHTLMMNEDHSASFCAVSNDHACNIINPSFRSVGIAVYTDAAGNTYLVEEFVGD